MRKKFIVGLMINMIIVFVVLLSNGCTNEKDFEKGKRLLEMQGFTNVESTGYEVFCCADEDTYSTGFTALDKQGNTVTGCICSGFGKGITIRYK